MKRRESTMAFILCGIFVFCPVSTVPAGGEQRQANVAGSPVPSSTDFDPELQNTLDAVVITVGSTPSQKMCGYGIVLGKGNLVVTPFHIIAESSRIGRHSCSGFITVISPYSGDLVFGKVILADQDSDVVLLEVPWVGHPSVTLAPSATFLNAADVQIISLRRVPPNPEDCPWTVPIRYAWRVKSIATQQGVPTEVTVEGPGPLDRGWSGSPFIIPSSRTMMGFLSSVQLKETNLQFVLRNKGAMGNRMLNQGTGPSSEQIRRLVEQAGCRDDLSEPKVKMGRPKDAQTVGRLLLRSLSRSLSSESDDGQALTEIEEYLRQRPRSQPVMTLLASQLGDQGRDAQAEKAFKDLLVLDPNEANLRVCYGQFLFQRQRYPEALEQLRQAKRLAPQHVYAGIVPIQVLINHRQFTEARSLADQEIRQQPNNAYLRYLKSLICAGEGKAAERIQNMEEAVTLWPEYLGFRLMLAELQEKAGHLDEAELHLRDAVAIAPEKPKSYIVLADFLVRQRPRKQAEARQLVQRALECPELSMEEKVKVQNKLASLQAKSVQPTTSPSSMK